MRKVFVQEDKGKALIKSSGVELVRELLSKEEIDPQLPVDTLNPMQTGFWIAFNRSGHKRVFISAPTSSGKTLCGLLFLKNFKENPGHLVYVVPTLALKRQVQETTQRYLPQTAIYTIKELALHLRRKTINPKQIKAAVIDEVHLLVKSFHVEEVLINLLQENVPFVAMSATVPHIEELATHYRADLLIESDYRPTKLIREDIISTSKIVEEVLKHINTQESQIIFVPSKRKGWQLLEELHGAGYGVANDTLPFEKDETLFPLVAFHSSEVPAEERQEIEDFFKTGKLPVLIATSTMAYGMNTPADKVIILMDNVYGQPAPHPIEILQMEGRAGRHGYRKEGRSLIISRFKKENVLKFLNQALKTPPSYLTNLYELYMLVLIAFLYRPESPEEFVLSFFATRNDYEINQKIQSAINFLERNDFVKNGQPTEKGLECIQHEVSPLALYDFEKRLELMKKNYQLIYLPEEIKRLRLLIVAMQALLLSTDISSFVGKKEKERYSSEVEKYSMYAWLIDEKLRSTAIPELQGLLYAMDGHLIYHNTIRNIPGNLHALDRKIENIEGLILQYISREELREAKKRLKALSFYNPEIFTIEGIGYFRGHSLLAVIGQKSTPYHRVEEVLEKFIEKEDEFTEFLIKDRKIKPEYAKAETSKVRKVLEEKRNTTLEIQS